MKYEDIGVIENKMEVPSYTINEEKTYFSNQVTFAEPQPERMNLNILQNNLGNCLQIIDEAYIIWQCRANDIISVAGCRIEIR